MNFDESFFAVIYVLGVFMSVKLRGNKEVAVRD